MLLASGGGCQFLVLVGSYAHQFIPCPDCHMTSSPCVSFNGDTNHVGFKDILNAIRSHLDFICKDLVSKQGHIHRFWVDLNLQSLEVLLGLIEFSQ